MNEYVQTRLFADSSEDAEQKQSSFRYLEKGIKAKGHTLIYKMHKYFARRPHNVFRYLLEFYTKPGDIVLDSFCGGGVTLVEGLAVGRRVVGVDLNPLATFVSSSQVTPVSLSEYRRVLNEVIRDIRKLTKRYYSTPCRSCGKQADVRWYELAYLAKCSNSECDNEVLLSNNNKSVREGKPVNGRYTCHKCGTEVAAVDAERIGYELLSVTYKCSCAKERKTVEVNEHDLNVMKDIEANFDVLVREYDLWFPKDTIPADWDRQQEDCLHRKSVNTFADFFTKRSLFFNAYLLKRFQSYRGNVSPDLYRMLLFTFSAIIRHTNNMTISTGNWMDGRPVSWAKHAYWVPNQFVEVNPIEYVEKRRTAVISGLTYQQKYLNAPKQVDTFAELQNGKGTHVIWNRSSADLDIPDESIDAIITDPPYGSNVQYGELAHFWLVWLADELRLESSLFDLNEEILVHRKAKGAHRKKYQDYFEGLKSVFSEGYRVLKPGGVLVFTFNNKDLKAWYAVIKAAIQAGFYLDPRGIIYQEPIEDYKNTAHTRYAGSLHGDFIYTFRKLGSTTSERSCISSTIDERSLKEEVRNVVEHFLNQQKSATTSQLYIKIMSALVPVMVKSVETDEEFSQLSALLEFDDLDTFLSQHFQQSASNKMWYLSQESSGN